jgi:4-amino-4-deoxy-L-arabinose transferase-like glycosyltransferase
MMAPRWAYRVWLPLVGALFLAGLLALIVARVMLRNLDHDEHQFVASGVQMARHQLLPYRDYAYFHVPLLTVVYAFLFRTTDYFLLAARGFSTFCSWLLLVTIFTVTIRLFRNHARWTRFGIAAGAVMLLAAAPLLIYTSGRAWNHDLPVLLAVWAFLCQVRGLAQRSAWGWLGLSGLLIGLACATRLSFLTVLPPMGLALWFWPDAGTVRNRIIGVFVFAGGVLIGLSPALLFLVVEPKGFLFGNVEYAGLNTRYREAVGYDQRMTLPGKLVSLVVDRLWREPGNLLIMAAYLWFGRPRWAVAPPVRAWLFLMAGVLAALFAGALAPTPSWPQYYYVLFPFLLLGALYGLAAVRPSLVAQRRFGWVAALAVLVAVSLSAHEYQHILKAFQPKSWLPVQLHETGEQMAALAGPKAKLLTLAPILPLEGRAASYPELTTGAFVLRAASLMPENEAASLHLVDPARLEQWLANDPPQAVLTNVHRGQLVDEAPLVAYAKAHHFTPIHFDDGEQLWLAARAEWGGAIRLVTVSGIPAQVATGATITPVFFLENIAPISENLNVSVRVVDQAGATVVQQTGWPWGRPTSTWQLHELWYDGHTLALPPALTPGLYRIETEFFGSQESGQWAATDLRRNQALETPYVVDYFVVGDWPPPTEVVAPAPLFGDSILLAGFAFDGPTTLRAGEGLRLRLQWQTLAPLTADYTAFVHLVDGAGALVAQDDQQPLDGFYPTSRWHVGQIIEDQFVLNLPKNLPPGDYTLHTGLYDLASGQRLSVVARPQAQNFLALLGQRIFNRGQNEEYPHADAWRLGAITVSQ